MPALDGRRIVVTRRKAQASELVERLRALGASVVEVPAIEVAPPADCAALDAALGALDAYDWIALTSPNAVTALLTRLTVLGLYPRLGGPRTKLASVGRATSAALRASFPEDRVALEPRSDFRAAGLLAAFAGEKLAGRLVLLPASATSRDELAEGLRALGARVEAVPVYTTIVPPGLEDAVATALDGGFDLALFASPSAVEAFARAAGERARGLPAAVIGPTTDAAAREAGLEVQAVAQPSTVEALVEAAVRVLSPER